MKMKMPTVAARVLMSIILRASPLFISSVVASDIDVTLIVLLVRIDLRSRKLLELCLLDGEGLTCQRGAYCWLTLSLQLDDTTHVVVTLLGHS